MDLSTKMSVETSLRNYQVNCRGLKVKITLLPQFRSHAICGAEIIRQWGLVRL
jgi:hypothetical protein